jgi:hypothetical protein
MNQSRRQPANYLMLFQQLPLAVVPGGCNRGKECARVRRRYAQTINVRSLSANSIKRSIEQIKNHKLLLESCPAL